MPDPLWIVLILAGVFLFALVLLGKRFKSGTLKVPGARIDLQAGAPDPAPPGGATMSHVKAGGSARNIDATGQQASMSNVEAGGDVENVAGGSAEPNRPKA